MIRSSFRVLVPSLPLLLLAFAGRAWPFGLQEVSLPPFPLAPSKITIDGRLDEWKEVAGYEYKPLTMMRITQTGGNAAVAPLLNDPVSATLKAAYDSDALYVAVEWHDRDPGANTTAASDPAQWADGGEGVEIHLLSDRTLHLACWPAAGGKGPTVRVRYDGGSWQEPGPTISAAGALSSGGKGYVVELCLPWSAVTASGKIPADGKLDVGADFAWNAIPRSLVKSLRGAMWDSVGSAQGVTSSFLTERPSLVKTGYISNPADWGVLNAGGTPSGDLAAVARDGSTSLAALPLSKAKQVPALDGSGEGWDPVLFQTARFYGAFWGDRFVARLAAQYDAQNLYLDAHFASAKPSNLKTESTQQGFNGGDAFQIRLSDGTKKINLCAWYDSEARKPALTADGKDLPSPFLLEQGAKENFFDDPKGGYIQEMAIPWKVLLGAAPKDGAALKATFQFWYADLGNRFSFHAPAVLEKQKVLSVAYKMPADGQLTLGLYGKDGKLLRWLVQDEFRHEGENRQPWDGLDQWAEPVAPGNYALKAIYHPPLAIDYKASVGNPGTPPWPTPDGKGDWLADESNPQGMATDGKWVFLAAPDAEKGFNVVAVDENGQRQWGTGLNCDPRSVALAVDGDYLYCLYSGPETTDGSRIYLGKGQERAILVCLDKETGKAARFTVATSMLRVATWPYREETVSLADLRNNKSYSPAVYGGQPRYACADFGETTGALGVAVSGGKVYVSMLYENKLLAVDAVTGKPTGDDIPVDAPAGLHALADGTLLAVSGKQIVKVAPASKAVTPFISGGLSAPFGVTVDKDGNVYVSDWGASFQVKVYDADGKFLHAVGKEGGRPWVGKWDPSGMLVPRGIAVTDEGKLWVAEDDGSPKRVSVWNAKSGALIRDYIGPTSYGGGSYFWIDPHDNTLVHVSGTRFRADYAHKTYVPEAVDFRRRGTDDPFTPIGSGGGNGSVRVLTHDGHEYLALDLSGSMFSILQRQGDVYRPVAALGSVRHPIHPKLNLDGTEMDAWDSDLGHHEYRGFFPDAFKGHSGDNFSWVDANGDNLVQPEEISWVKTQNVPYAPGVEPTLAQPWGAGFSSNWSFFSSGSLAGKSAIYRLDVKGWKPNGTPIYDIAEAKPIILSDRDKGIQGLYVTHDDRLIVSFGYEGWGNNLDVIACYDLDGHEQWRIALPKAIQGHEPGRHDAVVNSQNAVYDFVLPKLGDVVGTWAWHGTIRPYLFTTDGLYVGTLLDDTLLGPTALWGESYTWYHQAADGTPYVINGGTQAEHIFQVNGLTDHTGRFEGSYELTAADAAKGAALRDVPEQKAPGKPVLNVAWLAKPPAIDGDLSDWNLGAGVTLDAGDGRGADVALGRDTENLYLAYKVREPNPLRNGGSDWQGLFTTGDCVDVMLQTDPKADPNRRAPTAGDERLLLGLFQDKPLAVLYQPAVPGGPVTARLSTATFARIAKLDGAKVAVRRGDGFYTVEAAVPLKDLGLPAKPTGDLHGDVGVVFADPSGNSRSLRLYYYNQKTQMVNDLPTEATLQPGEWGVLGMPLGLNLLRNGGFEDPLIETAQVATQSQGWYIRQEVNGSDAALDASRPYSGHQCLLLETPLPVVFSAAAYDDPDYSAFLRTANDGKGTGNVEVTQQVPVIAGHLYSMRFRYRAEGLQGERKQAGHPRGYISFGAQIVWDGPSPARGKSENVFGTTLDTDDWQTIQDLQRLAPSAPYVAPEKAVSAQVVFSLRTRAEGHAPRLYIDDVELVDVTPPAAREMAN